MFEEIVKEIDAKVDLLIDKNIQYCQEIERLKCLLNEANSRNDELAPLLKLAWKVLVHLNDADGEEG